MLHEQVRQARIDRGLSQVKLAQLAKVPRSQLRKFENGEGITMTTFLKIIGQLPNLERLTIGPTELHLQNIDLEALRAGLTELIASAAASGRDPTAARTEPETDTAAAPSATTPPSPNANAPKSSTPSRVLHERRRRKDVGGDGG